MQRISTIALLTLTSLSCVGHTFSTQELLVSRHAVKVEMDSGYGSGFPITDSVYLTAWHVVAGEEPEDVTINGASVEKIIQLGELDVALVYMTTPHGLTPWSIEDRAPEPGEAIYKSGFGQGFHWWAEGIGTDEADRLTLDIWPGDSGGPVFDADGDVVGIVVQMGYWRGLTVPHHCWIVPMSLIVPELPTDLFEPVPVPLPAPLPAPLPVSEGWWDRFQRLRRERGV